MPQSYAERDKAKVKAWHGTEQHKKERAQRNAARAALKKKGVNVAGKDVGHLKPIANGGTNAPGNLKLQSTKVNRGYKRGKKNQPL